jgi:hypothetical protein
VSRRAARRDAVRRAPFLHAFATRRRRGTRPSAVQGSGLGAQATTPGDPAVVGTAAALLARARAARLAQDTALRGYDALARERITAAFALREGAPSTTVFRQETAARVRWSRGAGLALDLLGRRRYAIGRGAGIQNVAGDDLAPVPYYPGRDALWVGGGRFVRADVDTSSLVHPLAAGAERFYRYALGGEVTVRLPDGTAVPLRELRVTAVRPDWKLSTGSFWFDARDGQLVRAVYRVSGRMDLWATARASGGGPPAWARPFAAPMTGQLDVVTVEHGLYAGRFWLPRAQFARGTIRTGSSRIGVRVEQTFRYDAVDAAVPLGEVTTGALAAGAARDSLVRADSTAAAVRDSLVRLAGAANAPDARRARAAYRAWADSTWRRYRATRAARDRDECAASGATTATASATRYGRRLGDVRVHVPCDTAALAASPVFGGSGVLDENPSVWAGPERGTLVAGLDAAVPSAWAPQPLRLAYGHEFVRANRVEGVSYGAALRRELGAGWRWEAGARLGASDLEPNAELAAERTRGGRSLRGGAYRRLVVSDDWGPGFAIGATVQNLVQGLDEQFYHRAGGVELAGGRAGDPIAGGGLAWRLFGERQWGARGDSRLALPALFGVDRVYARNVVDTVAARGVTVGGAAVRWRAALVGDAATPWRVAADVRAEAAAGAAAAWARTAADATVERALPGGLRAAVTAAAGTSAGALPPQRWWNVGGWQTVRGAVAGTRRGSAFWNTRSELRWQRAGLLQPAAFFDAGWAGDRARRGGGPLRGAGGGVAVLDGLARFDVARGLDRGARWRSNFYVVARF